MSAGNSGLLPTISSMDGATIESGTNFNSNSEGEVLGAPSVEPVLTAAAEGENLGVASTGTRKTGRNYSTQSEILADINEKIKEKYPEEKRKAHVAVVGPAAAAKKAGDSAGYEAAISAAADRVHEGLSFPKKGQTAPTVSRKRSKLTNALNAARSMANSGVANANTAAAAAAAPTSLNMGTSQTRRGKKGRTATAVPNSFPKPSNSVVQLSASATTNEKDRLLASLTTMRDSAKEMIDSMYATANKLARGAAASNNGGLLRATNSLVPQTVTRKQRKNKGVARGPRSKFVPTLPSVTEETNSALRSENGMGNNSALLQNLSQVEPSSIETAQSITEKN